MMAEGGIQAADKENDSPQRHYLDAFGGGHFAAKPELLSKLVMEAPEAIQWLNDLGVMFDKNPDGIMLTTPAAVLPERECMPVPITLVQRSCVYCAIKSIAAFRL